MAYLFEHQIDETEWTIIVLMVALGAWSIYTTGRNKAKRIDTTYFGTQAGHVGPLEQHLQGFGDIQCLVAGQYGEISQDFHKLLQKLALSKASHISLLEGRPVSDSEQGLILHHLRRRVSVSIITSQSRCLLTRLHHMAPGAKEAAKKRAFSKYREELAQKDRLHLTLLLQHQVKAIKLSPLN